MYSISLAARPSGGVNRWYKYNAALAIGRAGHHVLWQHTTAMEMMDVLGLVDNTDRRAFAEFESNKVYEMIDDMSQNAGIRAHYVCNRHGQMTLIRIQEVTG